MSCRVRNGVCLGDHHGNLRDARTARPSTRARQKSVDEERKIIYLYQSIRNDLATWQCRRRENRGGHGGLAASFGFMWKQVGGLRNWMEGKGVCGIKLQAPPATTL